MIAADVSWHKLVLRGARQGCARVSWPFFRGIVLLFSFCTWQGCKSKGWLSSEAALWLVRYSRVGAGSGVLLRSLVKCNPSAFPTRCRAGLCRSCDHLRCCFVATPIPSGFLVVASPGLQSKIHKPSVFNSTGSSTGKSGIPMESLPSVRFIHCCSA